MAVGRMPATSTQVASEISACRALFAGGAAEREGRPVKALRFAKAAPEVTIRGLAEARARLGGSGIGPA